MVYCSFLRDGERLETIAFADSDALSGYIEALILSTDGPDDPRVKWDSVIYHGDEEPEWGHDKVLVAAMRVEGVEGVHEIRVKTRGEG